MADPKYANLPGIAHDQPDVFETSDLPESEQHLDGVGGVPGDGDGGGAGGGAGDESSDAVEVLHLSANEAFGKFKGKAVDARGVDFSDRLRPSKNKKGYVCWSGEYEICAPGEEETVLQKYQRLNCEVRELAEAVEDARDDARGGKTAGAAGDAKSSTMSSLAAKISSLQEELAAISLEETLGAEAVRKLKDPQGATSAKLLAHLEELKAQKGAARKKESASKQGSSGSSNVTYELMMKPDTAKLEEGEKVARMEKRLETLERALGADSEKMSSLTVETSQKTLLDAVSVLSARTSLLDPSHLDHVEARLAALQNRLAAVADRKAVVEDQEKAARINDLYDLVLRTHSVGQDVLPAVVDRLEALQGLHEKAMDFSKLLSEMESTQHKLEAGLASNETLLKETRKKFAENVSSIQENFQNVEKRVSQLQHKK